MTFYLFSHKKNCQNGKSQYSSFIIISLIISMILPIGCKQNSSDFDIKTNAHLISELEKLLDAKFPEGSRIENIVCNDRNHESACRYIIYSPSPIRFNMEPATKHAAKIDLEIIEKKVSLPESLGKLIDQWSYSYEGDIGSGEWRAYQTDFENGSYLIVQQIRLGFAQK